MFAFHLFFYALIIWFLLHRRERVTVSRFSVTVKNFQDGGLFMGRDVGDFYSGQYY
jgi:hypothetical protein